MTIPGSGSLDMVDRLRERAKELNCLLQVHDLTSDTERPPDEVCRELLEMIPLGWQHPDSCWVKITIDSQVHEPPLVTETPWVMREPVLVLGKNVGGIEVFYDRPYPPADDGPFLEEESKLLAAIAGRLGQYLSMRRMRSMLSHWHVSLEKLPGEDRREWRVIIEFLRRTDPPLLSRISRRMINYLVWNGVDEAQHLLERLGTAQRVQEASDDNQPIARANFDDLTRITNAAFRIAADNLTEDEIVHVMEQWVKDDNAGFLVEVVENQRTSVTDLAEALERFQHSGMTDTGLTRSVQMGLRASLVRRFLTEDLDYINTAKQYLHVPDFCDIVQRIIATAGSRGKLGGKSSGLLLAYHIVRRCPDYADALGSVRIPRTWYVSSDALLAFLDHNHLQDVHNRKYVEIEQVRREYPHIVQAFKHSTFPQEILKGLALALDDMGDKPLIVRSSSLLEDRIGSAFSGKYKSLFLANRGTKHERMGALVDAIAEVYASIFAPDPLEYRAERGMLDLHEEMGIMIQEVVGVQMGHYHLPAFAGVAFSHNEFRWSPRLKREDGLVRMVPGLGTRAVDRVSDDYPVLLSPGQPGLRANVTSQEILRYSPKRIDLINLEANRFATVLLSDILHQFGSQYPMFRRVFSACDRDGQHPVGGFDWDGNTDNLVASFEGLATETPFLAQIRALLRLLRERIGYPVDVEFAHNGTDLYLLQCRPQSSSEDAAPTLIPRDVPPERVLFTAKRYVSNGRVPDITHIVYVDGEQYDRIASVDMLRDVGRAVGRLNKVLPKRQFILIGPGRWGSRGDIKLGVNVTYSDINNTAMLMEVAAKRGNYVPELSFGTHFFQDLVESAIRYLPIYPDERGVVFNTEFLRSAPNHLAALVPDYAGLADTLRVINVPEAAQGQILKVCLNADSDEAIGFLAEPGE
jgi:pyruvate,water dikinase